MSNKASIVVRNATKEYAIKADRSSSSQRKFFRAKSVVHALRGVSLIVRPGESVGVIGRNGSGKSTLLRLISGGESPSSGQIFTSAQPQLLGVSAALMPNLSGAENIRIGCLAAGMVPSEIPAAFDEISEFADLGNSLYLPMNTYSSGMGARLKFAISTSIRPEILLVDEALSTGDAAFADKAKRRAESLIAESGTFFLVSHSAGQIAEMCERAIWIHDGQIVMDGNVRRVTKLYRNWSRRINSGDLDDADKLLRSSASEYTPPFPVFDDEIERGSIF
ncbi:Teichoic acids export ATP-binding protein TagH [Corynebacterium faecale]|uniref:ABC transporter ATP-binding protein n=1 Tax=Corynebacterium faecale TaxID=1758466 RepID=UPI0025B595AC|nr:ABC transporter ATP-binding protein [Corynebacterium faecale]WJY91879.1 Teichoic acids export ATP-binding protein TagH [Corynebacterium faecale]